MHVTVSNGELSNPCPTREHAESAVQLLGGGRQLLHHEVDPVMNAQGHLAFSLRGLKINACFACFTFVWWCGQWKGIATRDKETWVMLHNLTWMTKAQK